MASGGEILLQLSVDDSGAVVKVKQFGTTLKELKATLDNTATSVKKIEEAHSSLGRKFHDTVAVLGYLRFAVMDVHDVFLRLPMAILKTAGSIEQTKALLSGLSKELTKTARDAEGAVNFDYITKMAMKAPFEIAALSDSFVKFKSAGLDPMKGGLQALVDGVAKFGGSGETMKRASVAIQQMMGKGVISMEELRQQLGEAVPTAMADMATGMGLSMAALTKAVSKGTVESGDAINKMFNIMAMRSEGAAMEMMGTWNGMVAQLKTRMQLAAEEISKAGFGDAMKKVAVDIAKAMDSVQFKRLTDSAGAGLGEAVTTLSNFAKVLIDHADLIKGAALAWLAYKISFSAIGPALAAVKGQVASVASQYATQATSLRMMNEEAKVASLEKIQAAGAESRAQMAASAATVTALRTELAAHESNRVANLANYNAANAQALAPRPRGASGQFVSRESAQESVDNIAKVERANAEAMRKIKTDIDIASAAHGVAARQALEHGNAIDSIAGASTKATVGLTALQTAGNMASTAFTALGGWATVLNVAIAAGVYLWMNWGNAAEEAVKRADRARKGLSDTKDFVASLEAETDAVKNRKTAEVALAFELGKDASGGSQKTDSKRVAQLRQTIKDEDAKVTVLMEERKLHNKNLSEDAARSSAQDIVRGVDQVIAARITANQKDLNAIDRANTEAIKAAGENTEKKNEIALKYGKDLKDLRLRETTDKVAIIKASIDALAKLPNGDAANGASKILRENLESAQNELKMATDALGANKFVANDKAGKVQTKIEAFTAHLNQQNAKLKVELSGLLSSLGKIDAAAAAKAQIQAKLDSDDFDEKNKDSKGKSDQFTHPSAAAQNAASSAFIKNAEYSALLKDVQSLISSTESLKPEYENAMAFLANPLSDLGGKKALAFEKTLATMRQDPAKMLEYAKDLRTSVDELLRIDSLIKDGKQQSAAVDFVGSYQKLMVSVKAMGPDLENAMEIFADPLGATQEKKGDRFDKKLAKLHNNQDELQKLAVKTGLTVEQINAGAAIAAEGQKKAGAIDLANNYKTLVEENRKMGLEIIQDDRERTRQQIESENALSATRAANHIKDAKDAKVEIELIDKMQMAANKSAILRAEDLRLKIRTPLEKLTDDWKKSMAAMEDASAGWATNFVDMLASATTSGKIEFGSFVQSVLMDLLKIELKASLASPLNTIIKAGTDKLKDYLPNLGSNGPLSAPAASDLASSIATSEAAAVMRKMERDTRKAGDELVKLGTNSIDAAGSIAESALKQSQETISIGMLSTAFDAGTTSVYAFVAALNAGSGFSGAGMSIGTGAAGMYEGANGATNSNLMSMFGNGVAFADGGIMGSMGAIPLRKYAAGGIANSPQMAIFGEGDHNEAYVPLPDGRRIPVALSGQGQGDAPAVTVNVINQSGTPVAAQQGQPRFDGKQMILDVVLTAATQPGGFRDGMKGAMR